MAAKPEPAAPKGDSMRKKAAAIEYDPHDDRVIAHPVGHKASLMHLVKGAIGTGILAMPVAFSETGWAEGLAATAGVTLLCSYCLLQYIECAYWLCKIHHMPSIAYGDAFQLCAANGPKCGRWLRFIAKPLVNVLLMLNQLGICSVYVTYLGNNIYEFIDGAVHKKLLYLMVLVPLALIISLPNLKALAPFSSLGNCLMLGGLGIIVYYLVVGLAPLGERTAFKSPIGLPKFVSICLFALESVGVIVSVEAEMRQPKKFTGCCGVFAVSMIVVGTIYGTLGFMGYWRFGEEVMGMITDNLDKRLVPALVCRCFFLVAVFISYALQGYVIIAILWRVYLEKRFEGNKRSCCYEYLIRYAIVIVSGALPMVINKIDDLIGIFGALCLSILGFIVPTLMDMLMRYPDAYGRLYYRLLGDILLFLFGVFVLVLGLYTNIASIVKNW